MNNDPSSREREDRPARSAAERIDIVCDRFESAWRSGPRPVIEDYLTEIPDPERQSLLRELVATELELRRSGGEVPQHHEYALRFSDYDIVLSTIFDEVPGPGKPAPGQTTRRGRSESASTGVPFHDDPASRPGLRLPTVPGYEVLRELGRGGMGVVYLARQLRLNRLCALKMILAGVHSGPEASRRFLAEAQTIACLEHPNIVRIRHIGETDALPFFELEYVAGGSLDRTLDGTPWPFLVAAQFVGSLTQGVAEAHRLGIVHRDLKPANVLLGDDGNPRITDFGLAKALNADAGLTRTEAVLGSPSYMAPEQAGGRNKDVGPRADIYSLGAIFYELLTGRPPFKAATVLETLEQVRSADPVRPSRLQPGLPRDAETVCLTCLAKEPAQRYPTALALAEDLRRLQAGEAILARPSGLARHARLWCKRNPALAGLSAASASLLLVLVVGSVSTALSLNRAASRFRLERDTARGQATRAERAEQDADEKLWDAYLARAQASRLSGHVGRRFDGLEALGRAAALGIFPERRSELRDEAIACMSLVDLRAGRRWPMGPALGRHGYPGFDAELRLFARNETRGVLTVRRASDNAEIHRLPSSMDATEFWPTFSSNSRYLAASFNDGNRRGGYTVWDLERGKPISGLPGNHFYFAFGPGANQFSAAESDGSFSLFGLPSGLPAGHWGKGEPIAVFAFVADGTSMAFVRYRSADIQICNPRTGQIVKTIANAEEVGNLAWRGDGKLLAASSGNRIKVWDAETGALVSVLDGHQSAGITLAFSHGGEILATSSWDGTTRLWDPIGGRQHLNLPGMFLRWGPGDQNLLVAQGSDVIAFEVSLAEECKILPHTFVGNRTPSPDHSEWSVDFSPDGELVVSSGLEGVRIFGAADGKELGRLPIGYCEHARFRADGDLLTDNLQFGLARWPARREPGGVTTFGLPRIYDVPENPRNDNRPFSRDARGDRLLLCDRNNDRALLVDLASPSPKAPLALGPHLSINFVALSPDGRWAATGAWKATEVKVWDTTTGALAKAWKALDASVAFTPDSRRLVTCHDGAYSFYDVDTWQPGLSVEVGQVGPAPMAFCEDGRMMAIVKMRNNRQTLVLIDPTDGREIATLEAPEPSAIQSLAFSRDGRRLAAMTAGHRTQLWELRLVRRRLAEVGLDQGFPDRLPPQSDATGTSLPNSVQVMGADPKP